MFVTGITLTLLILNINLINGQPTLKDIFVKNEIQKQFEKEWYLYVEQHLELVISLPSLSKKVKR